MTTNPTASSMSLIKTDLMKMKESVSKTDDDLAQLKKAVESRIAQLEEELKQTRKELASTKKDLSDLQEAAWCMDAALDDQDAVISALASCRSAGGGANSGTDADNEDDGVQLTPAQKAYQDALGSPHLKSVIDESFRRTMATPQLRPAHLPAFEANAPNDQTKPVRFKWDQAASDVHNAAALERVVEYVLKHGPMVTPPSAPVLKVLTIEDVRVRTTKKFVNLARAFREHHAVVALNEKRDAQLARAAAAEAEDDSDQEEEDDAMDVDAPEDVEAIKIAKRKEKKAGRAVIQRRKATNSKRRMELRERLPDGHEYLKVEYNDAYIEQVQSAWEANPYDPEDIIAYDMRWESEKFKNVKRLELREDLKPATGRKTIVRPRRIPQGPSESASEDIPKIKLKHLRVAHWMVDPAWLDRHRNAAARLRPTE